MRIACPDCNAVYELPPERVRPGRGVKCAKCGVVWVPVALEDVAPEIPPVVELPEPEPVPESVPEPVVAAAVPVVVPPAPNGRPVALGWLLTVLVLAGLGWAAVTQRTAIMQAWPPSSRAYQWLRLS